MNRGQKEAVDLIERMLGEHGLTCTVHHGGKHLAVNVIGHDGRAHRITVANSPRSGENMLAWVRQDVNALLDRIAVGSGRGERRSTTRSRRRRAEVIITRHVLECTDGNHARNPWDALKGLKL